MLQIYRRTPMPKCKFNRVEAALLKSHLGMGVLLQVWWIYLFLRTPMENCFYRLFYEMEIA